MISGDSKWGELMRRYDADAAEFLPDALAIRHACLPWWARHGVLWMGIFLLLALLWACIGKVDVIVTARGKLVSDHPTIMMKPLERTVLKKLHVAEGDRVRAGQVLATFDPVFSAADKERLAADIRSGEARFERLRAEFSGTDYAPAEQNEETRWQHAIFRDRQRYHSEKMEYFVRELERITKTRISLADNVRLQRARLAGFQDIEGMLRRARGAQAVSPRDLKEAELTRMQLEADISDKENNMLVLESELRAKMAERDAFQMDWSINTAEDMVKTREALISARKEYDKAAQMTSYVELRAPEDAVVHDITPISIGSAVREAETLITLVPLGGTLEAEAEISTENIGKVHTGDSVRVKISAFPFQKYGTLEGTVRVISEDAFSRRPEEGRLGETAAYYRARVLFPEGTTALLMNRLIPGMETQAEIRVGERRIIEYLLHPIIKSLDEAIREP